MTIGESRRAELGYGSLHLRLPRETLELLVEESEATGMSRASLVDAAVRLYVGSDEARALVRRNRRT